MREFEEEGKYDDALVRLREVLTHIRATASSA